MAKKTRKTAISIKVENDVLEAIDKGAALNLRNRTTQVIWLLKKALEYAKARG